MSQKLRKRARKRSLKASRKPQLSATEIAAETSLSPQARQQAYFIRTAYAERDHEGGMMDGHHLRRAAPVRGLESLVKPNAKRKTPFLEFFHLEAARRYHADIEKAQGYHSHELREFVQGGGGARDGAQIARLEASDRLERIRLRMDPRLRGPLDMVMIHHPDRMLSQIYLSRRARDTAKIKIKHALSWLAVEYGLTSNAAANVDEGA